MRTRLAVAIATLMLGGSIFWAQTHSDEKTAPKPELTCGPNHSDLMEELTETNVYVSRMQSRIVMLRNSAGVIENPQLRNALQVNADMWQDEVDHLKQHMNRMQTLADRCEAQEKIKQGETQR
jgi:hypothetical protein